MDHTHCQVRVEVLRTHPWNISQRKKTLKIVTLSARLPIGVTTVGEYVEVGRRYGSPGVYKVAV